MSFWQVFVHPVSYLQMNVHAVKYFIYSGSSRRISSDEADGTVRLGRQRLRQLWKKAILETLLLIRMERENKNLQGENMHCLVIGRSSLGSVCLTNVMHTLLSPWFGRGNPPRHKQINIH